MKTLMIILLGLPGTPDPGVPQSVQLETSYSCQSTTLVDPGHQLFDTGDSDQGANAPPVYSSFCVRGMAGKTDQFGNMHPPKAARAAFIAVFDKRTAAQKAGVQIFFSASIEQCETSRKAYQAHIGALLGLDEDAPPYPRAACIRLYGKRSEKSKNVPPLPPSDRLVIGTDVLDPATAQFWTIPVETLQACLAAKKALGKPFDAVNSWQPVQNGMHRPLIGMSCASIFDPFVTRPKDIDTMPELHVMLAGFMTDNGQPIPGKPAVVQFPVRNFDRCESTGSGLEFYIATAAPEFIDSEWLRTQMAVTCIPLREADAFD